MLASHALADYVLADYPNPMESPGGVGDKWFLYIGPAVIFVAVILWVAMTLGASRIRPRTRITGSGMPNRGPVQGGVIEGSPSQRSRRDPAPSVTYREVMAHIEYERARERAVREEERAEAAKTTAGRHGRSRAGTRRKPKRRPGPFGSRKPR